MPTTGGEIETFFHLGLDSKLTFARNHVRFMISPERYVV